MELIDFEGEQYPLFQASGYASRFALPFAKEYCKGIGYDIGCNRLEWSLPDSQPIDTEIDDLYSANCLPAVEVDYIFSSHCLEHVLDWVRVLDYWRTKVKKGGVIFLYLPHYSQRYWRPWNNDKHINILTSEMLKDYFEHNGAKFVQTSGVDLNNSFYVVAVL